VSARRKARKRALDLLFEADVRGADAVGLLAERRGGTPPIAEYAVVLVEGVSSQQARLDELIATYSEGWTLDRMPAVDRALLRVAIYEILFRDEVPDAVAVSEAVELARELSTDESPKFVNGLLGRILLTRSAAAG
jgi:N utilization substance protein B